MNNIFIGSLTNGQRIISIGGNVDDATIAFAFETLDQFIDAGEKQIVFDFSGVKNVNKNWLETEVRIRESISPALSVTIRKQFSHPPVRRTSAWRFNPLPA